MAETSKATVAGILDIIAGIAGLAGGIPLLVIALVGVASLRTLGRQEDPTITNLRAPVGGELLLDPLNNLR